MDPKVLYWTGALVNMAALLAIALRGVVQVRHGDVVRHRRSMLTAASLVLAFVVSYPIKLAILGREDLAAWDPSYVHTLRFHELCVLGMVIAGGLALTFGRQLRRTSVLLDDPNAPDPPDALLRRHRLAGRTALASATLGLASAAVVLVGMYARS